jgi:hypothetical protein
MIATIIIIGAGKTTRDGNSGPSTSYEQSFKKSEKIGFARWQRSKSMKTWTGCPLQQTQKKQHLN